MVSTRQVSRSVVIDAPAAGIFDVLADPRRHHEIDGSGSVRGSTFGPDRLVLGSTFGMTMRIGVRYQITNRVVEFDEDRLIGWRHFAGHRWRYLLDAIDGARTRVTETFDYSTLPPASARLIEVLGFPRRNRRGIEATLGRLSALAERTR